ncbi:MAG TPA: carboxypeptidase regulatory-like domain-containing protein [Vicinamibacterales bacterium]|nr:carboxypeptidase regulatory-like domain-containing protein [Vicinamibacterales bacterium]
MRIETACLLIACAIAGTASAAEHRGQVTFAGLPVPGAAVTATHGGESHATVTDEDGTYRFADLTDGPWTIDVAMLGFMSARQDIVVAAGAPAPVFALTIMPFDQIASGHVVKNEVKTGAPSLTARATNGAGFQRATVTATRAADAPIAAGAGGDDRSGDAAEGFLINGSVNNSASSPFAQLAAFGNNRRGARSLYNGGIGVIFGNSAWDARPFSFTDQPAPKPSYSDAQAVGSFAGPVKIPGLRTKANVFLGYQHTSNHDATTQSTLVPTTDERRGIFSSPITDPLTGRPFPNNVIPASRISPQAAALMNFYPTPNVDGVGGFNFQAPVLATTIQDAVQTRVIQTLGQKNQVYGTVSFQRTSVDAANIFGFVDSNVVTGVDAPMTWSHRFSQFFTLRLRYQYTTLITHATPYFAFRQNVSGDAGITGNSQDPANWGSPNLAFSSGIAALTSTQFASNRDQTHAVGGEMLWNHGRHNVTFGGDVKLRRLDVTSQQNARGAFTFTGFATGSDVGDFLLGLPHSSAIAYGNADKLLRATNADAYVTDDWRLSPAFTANIGVRWEFESPFTEQLGRLVNLNLAPDFASATQVVSSNPLRADFGGFQPRVGVAWRPLAGSSLVVRGGYGIYRNTSVYSAIDLLLAQQPPLSTTLSVESSPTHPLTLANGFATSGAAATNTFAVDRDFRVGYAHNWQLLVQRDLPASLTIVASYLGTHGTHLLQESLPNTYPIGAANPCPACPSGFVYLASNGTSDRNAAQLQLRRRLRNGLAASVQYTLSKSTDDAAAAFLGASMNGSAIAQDWLHLDAERAPSTFDQRHLVTANFQYTSGVGVSGGALVDGLRGALLKGWTLTSQLTVGSGLPLTPVFLTSVPGTAITGSIRGDANGGAFVAPARGEWGTAGRNSIRGPSQFSLDAGAGRSFLGSGRWSLDWRVDATNILNHVTYTGLNTIVGSPQFGLPIQANAMRKLSSTLRVRF